MEINIAPLKTKMIMCRFAPDTFKVISDLAKKHKTSRSVIIRALVDQALPHIK